MIQKYIVIASIILGLIISGIAQTKAPIKIETSLTGDFIKNLMGGISTTNTYIGMEEFALTFDTENLGLWKGGTLFLHGLNTHGALPSSEIVGDLQVTSNIESGNYTGFYQYYYQQSIGNYSFLFGQHDLNSEFVGTEYGGTFINSSFGISPSISLNVPVSIYPLAAPSFIFKYEIPNKINYKLGIYDGDPGNPENNRYNLQPNINLTEGALIISEIEFFRLVNSLPENYKIGAYYHTNNFMDYNDTNIVRKGNYGAYFVSDLVLWSGFNHPDSYLGLFIQAGIAPKNINQINYYLGAGVHLNGILPNRFNDAFGIAFAYANMSTPYKNLIENTDVGEMAVEFTYKMLILDHYSIQPNLQYIINPGANTLLKNALVACMRFNIYLEN